MIKIINTMNIVITREDLKNLMNVLIGFRGSLDDIHISLFRDKNNDKVPTIRLSVLHTKQNRATFLLQGIIDINLIGTVSEHYTIPEQYSDESLDELKELIKELIRQFHTLCYMHEISKECGFDINITVSDD